MANLLDLSMLFCACLGAIAFGILAAFLVLKGSFALMRPAQKPATVKPQPEAARVS